MLAVLPVLAYLGLVVLFRLQGCSWRRTLVFASIPCGAFVALDTEVLSALHLITRVGIAASWALFATLILSVVIVSSRSKFHITSPHSVYGIGKLLAMPYPDAIVGIGALGILVGITALACAPNTWDAMEYHLPRVFEWMNNNSVGLYPTIDRQQLSMPPWAEYAMLHADLLFGGDRLVNLVQWFAYVGGVLVASLIAEELGADRKIQVFSSLICATIPSAVLGASGAQNDCVLAYWIALSTYFLLTWRRQQNWTQAVGLGCTLALSIFTKGTAYTFLPLLVIACAVGWTREARRRFLVNLPILAAICLVVVAPFWLRNYSFSGSIFGLPYFEGKGPVSGRMFNPTPITISGTAANVVRNIGSHLGAPSNTINEWTTRTLSALIRGIGVNPSDPGQLYAFQSGYLSQFSVDFFWRTEVRAGNNLHFLVFCLALTMCLVAYRRWNLRTTLLGLGIVGAFVLFCALVRWSLWSARYQLPLFVIAAPFTALVIGRAITPFATRIVMAILMLWALSLAVVNDNRPMITKHGFSGGIFSMPRDEQYFLDSHREMAASFVEAAHFVAAQSCRSIGIDSSSLRFEYPMLALISEDGVRRKIAYSSVQNSTTRFSSDVESKQCLIVCLGCVHAPEKWREYQARGQQGHSFGDFVVVMAPPLSRPDSDR